MRHFLYLLTFVIIVCLVQTVEARKLALLVGVDEYVKVKSLECCVNDIQALKTALMKIGFEENDIQILVTGDPHCELPTKKNIERSISRIISQAQPSDMVFLAFSGHGAQENNSVYFCPPEVDTENLKETCVSIDRVMDILANKCNAKFKWMVVDACRNNPAQGARGIGGRGLRVIPTPPPGIALFQSCAKGEESWEDRASGNGYFTKNFVAALSGTADANQDGKLTLMEVCSWTTAKTREQVKISQNKSQSPYFSGSVSDFTLTEDANVPKAKALVEEARKAVEEENYKLAIQKYDEAIALCPKFDSIRRERNAAKKLLVAKPSFNPKNITVPDNFVTIEEAYKHVKDGGIITIQPGKYELSAPLVVNRPVTFRGNGKRAADIAIYCSSSHVFKITGGSPSFQNLSAVSGAEKCGGFYIAGGSPKLFRCVISSRKGSGMYVKGANANPQVELCTLKDCKKSGVNVYEGGQGKFSNCEIFRNAYAGIEVKASGNPKFSRCKIHDGKGAGVYVHTNGLGEFNDCEIYGNALGGIAVAKSGNPTCTGCLIHDGKNCGVIVSEEGLGSINNCEIYGNEYPGIGVSTSGNPTVSRCKIYNGKSFGVLVSQKGLGKFNDCEIYGNVRPGIAVDTYGNPTVVSCKIHDGKNCGVYVYNNGMGIFNNNTLGNNFWNGQLLNWVIDLNSGEVKGYGNIPPLPIR